MINEPAPPLSGPPTEPGRVAGLRRNVLGMIVLLIVQVGVGVAVNLYATVPRGDLHKGVGSALGRAISKGPVGLSLHAVLGLLLVVFAISIIIRGATMRRTPLLLLGVVGLLALAGAAMSGAAFVDKPTNAGSMSMTVLAGVATLAYVLILYLFAPTQPETNPKSPVGLHEKGR